MIKFGIAKSVTGDVLVKDALGREKSLMPGDAVGLGDVVSTNIGGEAVVEFGSQNIAIYERDSLKLDQSVIFAESFDSESAVNQDSLYNLLTGMDESFIADDSSVIIGSVDDTLDLSKIEKFSQSDNESDTDKIAELSFDEVLHSASSELSSANEVVTQTQYETDMGDIGSTISIKIDGEVQTDFS